MLAAAAPASKLLLFELVIPDDAGQFEASDVDLYKLVTGRERTLAEYTQLRAAGGWELRRTVPTPSQLILAAVPRATPPKRIAGQSSRGSGKACAAHALTCR